MSAIYDVELDTTGRLILKPAANVTPAVEAVDLGRKYKDLFDKIRFRVPATPGRAAYQNLILEQVKHAFEDGDLDGGRTFLAQIDDDNLAIRYFRTSVDQAGQLRLAPAPWIEKPTPPEVRALMDRAQRALRKVRLVQTPADKEGDFRVIESHAKQGFEDGDIANANIALQGFEDQFVAEKGPVFRKKHLADTLWTAACVIAGMVLIAVLLQFRVLLPAGVEALLPSNAKMVNYPALIVGVCIGIVFFAFIRNLNLTFDSLGNFDAAQLAPWLRFTLVGVITVLLCIMMSAGLIEITINKLNLHQYATDVYAALIVGVLCGYADTAIISMLTGVLDRKPA